MESSSGPKDVCFHRERGSAGGQSPRHPATQCPPAPRTASRCCSASRHRHGLGAVPTLALAALCRKALAPAALSQLRELISAQLLWTTCFPRRGAALPMPLGPRGAGIIGCIVLQRAEPLVQTHSLPLSSWRLGWEPTPAAGAPQGQTFLAPGEVLLPDAVRKKRASLAPTSARGHNSVRTECTLPNSLPSVWMGQFSFYFLL